MMHQRYFKRIFSFCSYLLFIGLAACNTNERPVLTPQPGDRGFVRDTTQPGTAPVNNVVVPPAQQPVPPPRLITLDNGRVKVGFDLSAGGAITFLSERGGANMVNNFDLGRQIQNSLYAGPIPYTRPGKTPIPQWMGLGWNPVQTGDYINNPSRVITYQVDTSGRFYAKTAPLIWPLVNETAECTMETWAELRGNVLLVRSRTQLTRPDTTQYQARQQEAPCVYLNGPFSRRVFYGGSQPFTNGALTDVPMSAEGLQYRFATENWMALLNAEGRGVGLWHPNHYNFLTNIIGNGRAGGEYDNNSGYLTSVPFAVLDHNGVFEYQYALIVGDVSDIRQFVYAQPRPVASPSYRFTQDRQGWYYFYTQDTGWPIRGELNVRFDGATSTRLMSPDVFWRASAVPKVYLQAAFTTNRTTARFSWRRLGEEYFTNAPDRYVEFPIVGDGQFRTYELNLAGANGWQDDIVQISLDPLTVDDVRRGHRVRLRSVTATAP